MNEEQEILPPEPTLMEKLKNFHVFVADLMHGPKKNVTPRQDEPVGVYLAPGETLPQEHDPTITSRNIVVMPDGTLQKRNLGDL